MEKYPMENTGKDFEKVRLVNFLGA